MSDLTIDRRLHRYFPQGLPLSRQTVDRLHLRVLLIPDHNRSLPALPVALRQVAASFNDQLVHFPAGTRSIRSGDLITAAVITDVLRFILQTYCQEQHPGVLTQGIETARHEGPSDITVLPPQKFVLLYPPPAVLAAAQREEEYLSATSERVPHAELAVSEMILLNLAMENPAFRPFHPLYHDQPLRDQSPYPELITRLDQYFSAQPPVDQIGLTLFESLRAPMKESPDSLEGQLAYIRKHWASILPSDLLEQLLLASDILHEQAAFRLPPTGGAVPVLEFWGQEYRDRYGYPEPARFSRDADWMSNVVMIAKSTYVWLDQLSASYGRPIHHLSDIPDEELDKLAAWGFTGLWLIGVWERSVASQQIKQMMGNPEAAPSAYSLYDYNIASDLGGDEAYQQLKERAWQRGIRLASDMVPNHMGIYSRWVIEHPQWFMQLDYPPFPAYRFTGQNLSQDPRVTLQIEDGYWNHSDAAVVFKRTDNWTGDAKYIYHGNDGTSMPWNDTAQLNFMRPEVREAVIQTILHVARHFSIIRFDAAMTLAKKHYQRLWFPQPGDGGAIPSRAEHGMSRVDFDALFPEEFWREVVDRVTTELPDTLLLAEAFWLMEGYFVRTLGMHRVYNSAFMNMLKMEENSKYRQTIKNVLTFSPEVIKRFVNFMNNPDERTAVEQFGRGDKYIGVAMLMVTMPGLPMFGHGQIEGFTEKYGMEYRRAYWNESVDQELVRRHEQQIFPLMRRRYLFSGAAEFALYDFVTPEGWVDENVFAYSNRAFGERALILYNNAYNSTSGHAQTSTEINIGQGDETRMVRRSLTEALGLNTDGQHYYLFRDYSSGLEFIRNGRRLMEQGFWAKLHGYQYHALLDWRELINSDGSWAEVERRLDGSGHANLEELNYEIRLEPIRLPIQAALAASLKLISTEDYDTTLRKIGSALEAAIASLAAHIDPEVNASMFTRQVTLALERVIPPDDESDEPVEQETNDRLLDTPYEVDLISDEALICFTVVDYLLKIGAKEDELSTSALQRMSEWRIVPLVADLLEQLRGDTRSSRDTALLVWIMIAHRDLLLPTKDQPTGLSLEQLFASDAAKEFLRVNDWQDRHWFNMEQFGRIVNTILAATTVRLESAETETDQQIELANLAAEDLLTWAERHGYQVEAFLAEYQQHLTFPK